MTERQEIHARVKETFLKAAALPPSEREAFLGGECGADGELRREVETLLAHHHPASIVEEAPSGPARPVLPRSSLGSTSVGRSGRWQRLVVAVGASGLLVGLGLWTQHRLEETLLRTQGAELEAVLDTTVLALETWIEQNQVHLDRMARDPRVVRLTRELLVIERAEGSKEALRTAPAQEALRTILLPLWKDLGADGGGIVSDRGRLLCMADPGEIGMLVTPDGMRYVREALERGRVFVPPVHNRDFTREAGGVILLGQFAAVRGPTGPSLGALSSAYRAAEQFTTVFQAPRLRETGETYAFDARGRMLSKSRFAPEIQLDVEVRDPGGDLRAGYDPSLEPAARPLTVLARLAIAARDKDAPEERRGVVLEPYRNYRGAVVVGAWRWLDEYEMAVAAEIERTEALAALHHLDVPLAVLFLLLVLFVGTAAYSTLSVRRLRRRLRHLHQLGSYTLGRVLGQGGMGTVYLAEHALLKRPTAVKVLSGDSLTDEGARRFEREVRLACELTHPNTIDIYDFGQTPEGVFYYAMEYVDGPTLADLVARWGPLPPARTVHILRQICESLGEAHRMGIVHRDVKPQNVMLCSRGGRDDVVKVLDFGLVRRVVDPTTRELRIGGTLLYMAPERLKSPDVVDARADVYALGALAYLLLSGRPVFEYESEVDLLWKVVEVDPERLSTVAEQPVPPELDQVVMDCLRKDPAERPQGVGEVITRVEATPGLDPWTQEDAARWWQEHGRAARVGGATAAAPEGTPAEVA